MPQLPKVFSKYAVKENGSKFHRQCHSISSGKYPVNHFIIKNKIIKIVYQLRDKGIHISLYLQHPVRFFTVSWKQATSKDLTVLWSGFSTKASVDLWFCTGVTMLCYQINLKICISSFWFIIYLTNSKKDRHAIKFMDRVTACTMMSHKE